MRFVCFYVLQNQRFTYSSLIFIYIAFKLSDLGQISWVSFHKFLTVLCWNSGPFLPTELELSQVYGCLAQTHVLSSAHKISTGLRSGLCDGHSKTLTLLSFSHFITNVAVCLGSLSIWKTHFHPSFNFLTDILRFCYNIDF